MLIIPGLPGHPSLMLDTDLPPGQARMLIAIAFLRPHVSVRELGKALGIKSTNGVMSVLLPLKKKGWITWEPVLGRTLRLARELTWREIEP